MTPMRKLSILYGVSVGVVFYICIATSTTFGDWLQGFASACFLLLCLVLLYLSHTWNEMVGRVEWWK